MENDTLYEIHQMRINPNLVQIQEKWLCVNSGGEWLNQGQTFDNVYKAIGTLFIMASASQWSDYMYLCASVTEIDHVQIQMNQPFWIYYYIFFTIMGTFFLLNLFVGVVISMFNSEQDKIQGKNLLTEKQKEWLDTRLLVLKSTPMLKLKAPENLFRKMCYFIQKSRYYTAFCLISIIANTMVLGFKWYKQPDWIDSTTEIINYAFTCIFTLEILINISSYGFRAYFKDYWNLFDFIIILISWIGIAVTLSTSVNIRGAVTIIRAFRVMRVLRLIKRAKSLNMIFNTFLISLPTLFNITCLLAVLLYLYSILGMQLFGNVMYNGLLNDTLNFETFTNALCVLFAVATGDNWSDIMSCILKRHSIIFQCQENATFQDFKDNGFQPVGCGLGTEGIFFFFSFYLLLNLIFLNLFIAIILQGFQETNERDQRLFNQDLLTRFREAWAEFDPYATSFIKTPDLKYLLVQLGEPLGFSKIELQNPIEQDKFIASLQLPTYHDMKHYQFVDVLDALSLRSMVLDHIKKNKTEQKQGREILSQYDKNDKMLENLVKSQIERDINGLILKREKTQIKVLKEMHQFQVKKHSENESLSRDKDGLNSLHIAAAAIIARKWKNFIEKRRAEREQLRFIEGLQTENSMKNQNQGPSWLTRLALNKQPSFNFQNQLIFENQSDRSCATMSRRTIQEASSSNQNSTRVINNQNTFLQNEQYDQQGQQILIQNSLVEEQKQQINYEEIKQGDASNLNLLPQKSIEMQKQVTNFDEDSEIIIIKPNQERRRRALQKIKCNKPIKNKKSHSSRQPCQYQREFTFENFNSNQETQNPNIFQQEQQEPSDELDRDNGFTITMRRVPQIQHNLNDINFQNQTFKQVSSVGGTGESVCLQDYEESP